jgi:molybdopterin/thiamine biosynthesis adenylyltransferase/rhodanese-related sulfurtransferase/molybdopterin converting factor small subunit
MGDAAVSDVLAPVARQSARGGPDPARTEPSNEVAVRSAREFEVTEKVVGPRVDLPPSLRELIEELPEELRVPGTTVDEVLHALVDQFPTLQHHVFSPSGAIRTSILVLVNDDDIRYRQRGRTPVSPGDHIVLVPALAGGAPSTRTTTRAPGRLTPKERHRYSRHLLLPEVGEAGQLRLRNSRVLLVGAGGLGAPAALYLAAAGVGTLGLVDGDVVEDSNLQRQVLYDTASVGRSKTGEASRKVRALNPNVRVVQYKVRLTSQNALRILRGYDVVLDGTDNFPTRYLVNDACVLLRKPDVYGSVYRFEGQVSVFDVRHGPCYRCLFPEPPPPEIVPSCAEGGVLGVVPGVVGVWQATEVLKLLLGIGEPLVGRLLLLDTLSGGTREVRVRKDPRCPVCGKNPTQKGLIDYASFCGMTEPAARVPEVAPGTLSAELRGSTPPALIDVREPGEWAIAHLPKARLIPKGTLPRHLPSLPKNRAIVVYCKTGRRSADAVRLLLERGFVQVRSLAGGIDAWADSVDPAMPRY